MEKVGLCSTVCFPREFELPDNDEDNDGLSGHKFGRRGDRKLWGPRWGKLGVGVDILVQSISRNVDRRIYTR